MTDIAPTESATSLNTIDPKLARLVAIDTFSGTTSYDNGMINALRQLAGKDPDNALKVMAGEEPPSRKIAEVYIDRKIGVVGNMDSNTGLRNRNNSPSYEKATHQRTKDGIDTLYNFLERGVVTDKMMADVFGVLVNDPGYRDIIAQVNRGLTQAQIQSYLRNPGSMPSQLKDLVLSIIGQPDFSRQIKEILKEKIKFTEQGEDALANSMSKNAQLQSEIDTIEQRIDQRSQIIDSRQSALGEYGLTVNDKGEIVMGSIATKVNETVLNINDLNRRISSKNGEIRNKEGLLGDIEKHVRNTNSEIRKREMVIVTLEEGQQKDDKVKDLEKFKQALEKLEDYKGDIEDELEKLKDEIQEHEIELAKQTKLKEYIEGEHTQLTKELEKLMKDQEGDYVLLNGKQQEFLANSIQLSPLLQKKLIDDLEFVAEIEAIVSKATVKHLEGRLESAGQNYTKLTTEKRTEDTSSIDQFMTTELNRRYLQAQNKIDVFKLKGDFDTYLRQGPRELIKKLVGNKLLEQIRNKYSLNISSPLTPDMVKEYDRRIDELVATYGDELIKKILLMRSMLSRRRKKGFKISNVEANLIHTYNPNLQDIKI